MNRHIWCMKICRVIFFVRQLAQLNLQTYVYPWYIRHYCIFVDWQPIWNRHSGHNLHPHSLGLKWMVIWTSNHEDAWDGCCVLTIKPDCSRNYWRFPLHNTISDNIKSSTKIFQSGVPSFETGCPCGVWCRGLTTYLLYVGRLFVVGFWV